MRFTERNKQRVIEGIVEKVIGELTSFTLSGPQISINSAQIYSTLSPDAINQIRTHLVASLISSIDLRKFGLFIFPNDEQVSEFEGFLIAYIAGKITIENRVSLVTGEGIQCTGLIDLYFKNTRIISNFVLPSILVPAFGTASSANNLPSLDFRVENLEVFNLMFSLVVSEGSLKAIQGVQCRQLMRDGNTRAFYEAQERNLRESENESFLRRATRSRRVVALFNTPNNVNPEDLNQRGSSNSVNKESSTTSSPQMLNGFFNKSNDGMAEEVKKSVSKIVEDAVNAMIMLGDASDDEVMITLKFLLDEPTIKNCRDFQLFKRIKSLVSLEKVTTLEFSLIDSLPIHPSLNEAHREKVDKYLRQEIKKCTDLLKPAGDQILRI